jgi:hypothetical protein
MSANDTTVTFGPEIPTPGSRYYPTDITAPDLQGTASMHWYNNGVAVHDIKGEDLSFLVDGIAYRVSVINTIPAPFTTVQRLTVRTVLDGRAADAKVSRRIANALKEAARQFATPERIAVAHLATAEQSVTYYQAALTLAKVRVCIHDVTRMPTRFSTRPC